MKIDLTNLPIIDAHCHRFCPQRENPCFAKIAGSGFEQPLENYKNTLLYGMLIDRLRVFLGLPEGATDDEVIAARNEFYHRDPKGYFGKMTEETKTEIYCAEIGSPLTGKPYQPDEIAFYNSVIPAEKRRNIVRVERLFDSLVEEALPFGEFIAEFHKRIDEQIKEENAIALKTVIAYYGGLEVEVVDDNSAKTAYENYLKDPTNKVVSKRIHDYMVAMGLDACKRNDIPMQIHTGMGECTMINMFTLSPAYLYPLFTDPRYLNKVKIVLLHSGYPHVELTGYLVNQFPHLYTDFSSVVPFASIGAAEKFLNLLERAPVNKIQFGSDSGGFPELAWFGPIYFKEELAKALQKLVDDKVVSYNRAMEMAKMVLHDNAKNIYTRL